MPNVSPARQARGSRKRPSNNVSDNEEADSTAAVAGGCKAKASAKRQRVEGGKTGGGNGGEEEDKGRVDGDLAEGLVCTICASVLFQSVSVWPCLHTFCGSCLSRWMTQKKTCPQCRGKLEKKRVAMNPFVTRLVDELLQNHPHLDTRTVEDKKQQTEANRFLPSAGHVVQIDSSDSDSSSLGSLDDDDVASGAWGLVELSDDDEDEIDVTTHEADTTYVPESDGDEPDDASALSPSGDSHDDDSDAGEQSTQTGVGDTSADVSSSMLQASGQSSMDEDDDDDAVPAGQRQRSSANSARRQRHRVSSRRAGSITSSSSDDSDSEWVPNARARPARRGGSGRRGRPRGRSAAGTARSARGSAS